MAGQTRKFCGRNSVVECQLPKLDVVGSNPIARFFGVKMGVRLRQSLVAGRPSLVGALFLGQKQGFRFRNVHKRSTFDRNIAKPRKARGKRWQGY
jgi:hypothetical protein